jgi:hypothetical protein
LIVRVGVEVLPFSIFGGDAFCEFEGDLDGPPGGIGIGIGIPPGIPPGIIISGPPKPNPPPPGCTGGALERIVSTDTAPRAASGLICAVIRTITF